MVSINAGRVVAAKVDDLWSIVSDVDRDPDYWPGVESVQNVRKSGNTIERSVVVGFMGRRGKQTITLNPKDSVELRMTSGPLRGTRMIRLKPLEMGRKTEISVSWDFGFWGVPPFANAFVKSQLELVTEEALDRIAKAAEEKRAAAATEGRAVADRTRRQGEAAKA